MTKARDAQFELLDALLLSPAIERFPELSLSPIVRRQWPSAYAALERGAQDQAWLTGPGQSWALPVNTCRITPTHNAVVTGADQVRTLCETRQALPASGQTIITGDGAYGNHRFLGAIQD